MCLAYLDTHSTLYIPPTQGPFTIATDYYIIAGPPCHRIDHSWMSCKGAYLRSTPRIPDEQLTACLCAPPRSQFGSIGTPGCPDNLAVMSRQSMKEHPIGVPYIHCAIFAGAKQMSTVPAPRRL